MNQTLERKKKKKKKKKKKSRKTLYENKEIVKFEFWQLTQR